MFADGTVTALGDDAEFHERRLAAAVAAHEAAPPSFTQEEWRYTPVDELDFDKYTLTGAAGASGTGERALGASEPDELWQLSAGVAPAVEVHVVDGAVTACEVRTGGVSVSAPAQACSPDLAGSCEPQASWTKLVGSVLAQPPDAFATANLAFAVAPVVIEVEPNVALDGPVLVRVATTVANSAWFPRLVVTAGRASAATVIEHHTSTEIDALVCPVTELAVDDAAHLTQLCIQDVSHSATQIATQASRVGRDATVSIHQVALGGAYARMRIDSNMAAPGGHGDISAVYFGDAKSVLDFRTFQRHTAAHTTSNLRFKGALDDHSKSIYTGTIMIAPDAAFVDADQTNHNLKLSPHAWSDAVPNLEIENNDVKCSHASSSGPVDPDQVFYLGRLGISPEVAELALVEGFFADITDDLPDKAVAVAVGERIGELLDAHRASAKS